MVMCLILLERDAVFSTVWGVLQPFAKRTAPIATLLGACIPSRKRRGPEEVDYPNTRLGLNSPSSMAPIAIKSPEIAVA